MQNVGAFLQVDHLSQPTKRQKILVMKRKKLLIFQLVKSSYLNIDKYVTLEFNRIMNY